MSEKGILLLDISPLSINKAFRGKRFKSAEYKQYAKDIEGLLWGQKDIIPAAIKNASTYDLDIKITFYYSPTRFKKMDIDNAVKPLLDVLVSNGIIKDDRYLTKLTIEKILNKEDGIMIIIEKETE